MESIYSFPLADTSKEDKIQENRLNVLKVQETFSGAQTPSGSAKTVSICLSPLNQFLVHWYSSPSPILRVRQEVDCFAENL